MGEDPFAPATPVLVPTKMVAGSVGWTAILEIVRPPKAVVFTVRPVLEEV